MSEVQKNAIERIEDLEKATMSLHQGLNAFARDFQLMRDALKLLGSKLDATVKAVNDGGEITDDILSKLMIDNSVRELKGKVDKMVTDGLLIPSNEVTENSFVVLKEVDPNGKTVNPRMQTVFSSFTPEIKEKIKGTKLEDSVALGDTGYTLQVIETYEIKLPEADTSESEDSSLQDAAPSA